MEFDLNPEQQSLKESVRRVLEAEFPKSYAREMDEKGEFPYKLWHRMAELGWTALPIPEEYGGAGGTILDMTILMEELARWITAGALLYMETLSFGAFSIICHGNEEQKKFFLPRIAKGEIIFSLGLTEPSGGSDALSLSTTATADGDEFIINGEKIYITMAHVADYMIVVARTEKNVPKRSQGISLFVADTKTQGMEIKPLQQFGMKATHTNRIFFNEMRIPQKNLLGELNRGWYHLLSTLNNERIVLAAMGLGIAEAAYEDALRYAKERQAFGKPIGQFQAIQHRIVNMAVGIETTRLLVYKAATLQSQGRPCGVEATMAKLVASETAYKNASEGMHILAGHGYMMDTDMQRYFRDARLGTFSPVSNDMARNYIGESLGLPRSY